MTKLKPAAKLLIFLAIIAFSVTTDFGYATAKTQKRLLPETVNSKGTASVFASDTIRISFIGDVMQHGSQIIAALKKGEGCFYDYENAFKYMESRFKKADLMVANMEMTVGTKPYSGYPNFSAPPEIAVMAKKSGIDLFLMANNHIADKGEEGLANTFANYESLGIKHTGVFKNADEKEKNDPLVLYIKGVKIAFINFTYDTNGMPVPEPYIIDLLDSADVIKNIAKAKQAGAELIIACPHWGTEYQLGPDEEQTRWAKMLFNNGVQIIIGSHPHVPEEGYIYAAPAPESDGKIEKMVIYSMGNYISNQSDPAYTQVGTFLQLSIVKDPLTGKISVLMPQWEYTWCFRRGELSEDFTVVPIEEFMKSDVFNSKNISPNLHKSFKRMKKTFGFIKGKELIKTIPQSNE